MNIFSFLNPSKNTDTAQKDMENKDAGKKPHKKPSVSLHSKNETVDFSIHYKNKMLSIYLYIKKDGLKETWKAKLNEEEMNKLLYNLFFIFSNPEPFHQELQNVYPDKQLEKVININPNPRLNMGMGTDQSVDMDKTMKNTVQLLEHLLHK
jgi:hypothetical protein